MTNISEFLLTKCRKIRLEDYAVQAHIGVLDQEKNRTQEVIFSIDAWVKDNHPVKDNISSVYDYRLIPTAIEKIVSFGHIELQETLAEQIAAELLIDARVLAVRIYMRKTEAEKKAKSIGIEIFRDKLP